MSKPARDIAALVMWVWPTILLVIIFCLPAPTRANGPIHFFENFDSFAWAGFTPAATANELDSNIWAVTGLSEGAVNFGDSQTGGDFARGPSSGGATTGGIYAFDVGGGNIILGVQPTDPDFTPGEIILRLQNDTGATITQLDVSYDIWYFNDQNRSNALTFSYSLDDVTYTPVAALDFTTPPAADGAGWQSVPRSTTLTGLNIAAGGNFYLKWTGDDVPGAGFRDEYGLDNVQVNLPAGDSTPFVATTSPAAGAANVAVDANRAINFSEAVTPAGAWFSLNCSASGAHSAAVSGGPQNYTLDPDTDFTPGEMCSVSILAAQITDQDGPPDRMASDYAFDFTIAAAPAAWIINEIHADPHPTAGDANGDGIVDTSQDEFVEIINNSGAAADMSGWTLSDGIGVKHTFPAGTILPNQCAIVVFAGGAPTGSFGGAPAQTASSGQLGLNNGGDTLTLSDGAANLAAYSYGSEGGDDQSLTRLPDITGPEPLVKHTLAGGALFSPGTRIDGSPFAAACGPPDTPPALLQTTPAAGATGVPVTSTIHLHFDELVSLTPAAVTLECPAGTPISLNITPASPAPAGLFTLTPAATLPHSATCSVSVTAAEVVDQDGAPDTMAADYLFTFDTAAPPAPPAVILISELLYDGLTPSTEGDEFVELCNPNSGPVDLTGYKVGDEETAGGGESMYYLPPGTILAAGDCLVIAKNAADFQARFGMSPNFEIGHLTKYTAWGSGSWSLANTGDELLLLGPGDEILDSAAYRNGNYALLGLEADATAPEPHSLQRVWPIDTNSMPHDFARADPTPGALTLPPPPPGTAPPAAALPGGMNAYWGHLHAHTTYSDGAGPPHYALAVARAAGLHFYAITDHGWWLTADEWAKTLTQTISATAPGQFVALRGIEWSHDTAGHINVFNTDTLLRRTDPLFGDLSLFYTWLANNPNVIAQFNHPDPSYGGTFHNFAFHPAAAQLMFMQEIGNSAQRYTTYEPSFIQANTAGWRVAPTNNSDTHSAGWGSDTPARTGIVAPALNQADLLDAMRARRVFATEDSNLALAMQVNNEWMGSVLTATGSLPLSVYLVDPDPEPITLYLYDNNLLLATAPLTDSTGQWSVTVQALPGHFFWVKAVQADGDTAYSAPVWFEGQAPADTILINEILPAPYGIDWDGSGVADHNDEWIELFNPLNRPVGLGGWQLQDAAGVTYNIPLEVSIPAGGFAVLYHTQTGVAFNNGGDTLTLIHPNGTVIDSYTYGHSPGSDESWCRLPDGSGFWSDDCRPTPGGANMQRPAAEPLKVKIFEAKQLTLGAWVRVKGRVTAPPDLLGSRVMYIQDSTAGIRVYLPANHGLYFNLGDEVEVEGNLELFRQEFEIDVDDRGDVRRVGYGPPPHPLPIATTSLLEPYEGLLVMLQGQAVQFRGSSTLWVDDGTGWAKVVIRRSTGIRKPFIKIETPITVVGIVSQYSGSNPSRDDYQLLLRYRSDLQVPADPPPEVPANWPTFLPETGQK